MAAAIFLCLHLLRLPSPADGKLPFWLPFVFAFGIGFISGSIVPDAYRHDRGHAPQSAQPPPAGMPPASDLIGV